MDNLTIVICTLNSENTIKDVITSLKKDKNIKKNNIIIIDGKSSDNTVKIASKLVGNIYFDEGKGLSIARNIGLDMCETDYIFYVGPDNLIPKKIYNKLIFELESNNWVGISATSYYENPNSYFEKSFNIYKKSKFYPGEKNIIGTPWLYKTSILKKFRWGINNTFSDDTDLCQRLIEHNYKVGISKKVTYEIGKLNLKEIIARWKMYGKSDYEFYFYNTNDFNLIRKIRSFFNPFIVDLFNPLFSSNIKILNKVYIVPFLIFISIIRFKTFLTNFSK